MAASSPRHDGRGLAITALVLLAVMALGAGLRLTGLDWDEGHHLHPDERFLAMVESNLEPVASLSEYLDTARSPLNPNNRGFGFFVYGNLPITIVQYLGSWLGAEGNDLDRQLLGLELGRNFGRVHLLGRTLSAICDVLTTLLIFAIGATLYGRAVGLLAAAFYSTAVLPIQLAHFFTVDAIANLFVVTAFWLAVRAAQHASWTNDVLFGLALGAGLASKVSVAPIALMLMLGLVIRLGVQHAQLVARAEPAATHRRRTLDLLVRAAISLNVVALVAVLAFRLWQPYAFLPQTPVVGGGGLLRAVVAPALNPAWLEQMEKVGAAQRGDDDAPPNHQWATRAKLIYPWHNLVAYGLGWPLGFVAWLGWAWALAEGLRGRAESWRHVLPVAWIGLYFAWFGAGWVLTMRYFLPLCPALCLMGAWALVRIAAPECDASRPGTPPPPRWRRIAGIALLALVLLGTVVWAVAFTRIYTRPHTRIAASRWIYRHLPGDVTLTITTAAGSYPLQVGLPNNFSSGEDAPDAPVVARTRITPDDAVGGSFIVPRAGHLATLRLNGVRAADATAANTLLLEVVDGEEVLASCTAAGPFPPADAAPRSIDCPVETIALATGHSYTLRVHALGGAVMTAGASLAHEGAWDDGLPVALPGYEPWQAVYQMYALEMSWEDDAPKRRRLQNVLDRVEYLVISSNRFYGSLSRNPLRWPMSIDYYQALFDGRLGFEMVADFTSAPAIGALEFDDQDAEEAFTVYDHPRAVVFRKRDDYSPANVAAILGRADLQRVQRRRADQVGEWPVTLRPPPLAATATPTAADH